MTQNLEERVRGFCQKLVQTNSLSGREQDVARLVQHEMQSLGYDSVEVDSLGSVVGLLHVDSKKAAVAFDAHMDVVPVCDENAWTHPPFSGVIQNQRLWGRGATDIKGSLGALIVGLGLMPRKELRGSVLVCASVGEEVIEGAALLQVLKKHPVFRVVICEPTGLRLGLGHKGRTGLCLTSQGKAAHTSQPQNGINAVYKMIEAIERVRKMPATKDDCLGNGIMELVQIDSFPQPGGSTVPYECNVRFDRRLVRGETKESVEGEIQEVLKGIKGIRFAFHQSVLNCYTGAKIEQQNFHIAWSQPPQSLEAEQARTALQSIGQPGEFWVAPYSTNGEASGGHLGLPTLIYGAGEIDAAHAVDENVEIEQLVSAAQGYQALAKSLSRL